MSANMQGKVVLVAGGTGGLGKAIALAFLESGAHVAVTYLKEEELVTLQAGAGEHSSCLNGYLVDVTSDGPVHATVAEILAAHAFDAGVIRNAAQVGGNPLAQSGEYLLGIVLGAQAESGQPEQQEPVKHESLKNTAVAVDLRNYAGASNTRSAAGKCSTSRSTQ